MNKIVLVGIAILAVGLIALPQTFALFAGQHDWYSVNNATGGNTVDGVPCAKCHADVRAQMDNMGANQPHTSSPFAGSDGCIACHVDAEVNKGAVLGGAATQLHAAAAPMCLDCHGDGTIGNSFMTSITAISIFGETYSANGVSAEAHGEFARNASATGEDVLRGANEACVGCHTHVGVNASWVKPTMLTFTANVNAEGSWVVSNFGVEIGTGYTNTTGQPVGNEPYNEKTGIAVINETGKYIPAP